MTFPGESWVTTASFDMRTAPDALGCFVGDYTGLDDFGTTFHPGWVGAGNGNTARGPSRQRRPDRLRRRA